MVGGWMDGWKADLSENRVEFPEDKVGVLQTNDHIHVEQDGEVKTQ
jgi:hypothetical protein